MRRASSRVKSLAAARRPGSGQHPGWRAVQGRARRGRQTQAQPDILLNSEGRPRTQDGFRASCGEACKRAGIEEVTLNDLRGTAVTRIKWLGLVKAYRTIFEAPSLDVLLLIGQLREGSVQRGNP